GHKTVDSAPEIHILECNPVPRRSRTHGRSAGPGLVDKPDSTTVVVVLGPGGSGEVPGRDGFAVDRQRGRQLNIGRRAADQDVVESGFHRPPAPGDIPEGKLAGRQVKMYGL